MAQINIDHRHPSTSEFVSLEKEIFCEKKYDATATTVPSPVKNGEVVWQYLTFHTALPHLETLQISTSNVDFLPPPPNLEQYTDPFDWPSTRKSFTLGVTCFMGVFAAFSAGSYTPGVDQMSAAWGVSHVATLVGVTTFTIGFAIAPMILAPFSEINGRRPVFVASGLSFALCQLCCGLTHSYAGMLVARLFVGVFSSTFSTMIGGVVSDIYRADARNAPMALFSGAAMFGTGLGPAICGYIAQNTTWRWIFYTQAIACGTIAAFVCLLVRETRGSVLLSRKAKALNQYYEACEKVGYYGHTITDARNPQNLIRVRWKVKADEDRPTLARSIAIALYRPFHLLVAEPVVFWFSLWVSFSWAVLYLTLAAVPLVFITRHGFSIQQSNTVFVVISMGSIIATLISIYQERFVRRRNEMSDSPEKHLYYACIESACMPIGMFMFGWTSGSKVHWIVPAIAIGLATIGIYVVYLAVFNYLADTYHEYASSALAAQSFCRNMLAGVFPLITTRMYTKLDYGPASSLLGGIGTLLTIVPWILVFYGPRIRARSKFASQLRDSSI